MKLIYDSKHNIAYLRLHEKKAQVDTIRVSDELNVDVAPDGTVYGIELLNANVQLEAEDNGNLVVINEAIGLRQNLPLAVHEGKAKYKTAKPKTPK
jgi:uncharacterized protein YuzE